MGNAPTCLNDFREPLPAGSKAPPEPAESGVLEERSILSAILDTVPALVVVLNSEFKIIRFNRTCEQSTGYSFADMNGKDIAPLFYSPGDAERFRFATQQLLDGRVVRQFESYWKRADGSPLAVSWTMSMLYDGNGGIRFTVATGIDRTENKQLQNTVLEISGREQRRIGQDLHDGLGQHLTGIAFLAKVQEQRLADKSLPEAADAAKIVKLVNEAIYKTRELARGLLPVLSEPRGLAQALQELANEVEDIFRISCRFECDDPISIQSDEVADQLFRIAQEAVHNAIRHGIARNIVISFRVADDNGLLTIRDDGCGITAKSVSGAGIGLRIMQYRTDMIGGSLYVERLEPQGTLVTCRFLVQKRSPFHEAQGTSG